MDFRAASRRSLAENRRGRAPETFFARPVADVKRGRCETNSHVRARFETENSAAWSRAVTRVRIFINAPAPEWPPPSHSYPSSFLSPAGQRGGGGGWGEGACVAGEDQDGTFPRVFIGRSIITLVECPDKDSTANCRAGGDVDASPRFACPPSPPLSMAVMLARARARALSGANYLTIAITWNARSAVTRSALRSTLRRWGVVAIFRGCVDECDEGGGETSRDSVRSVSFQRQLLQRISASLMSNSLCTTYKW
jgi:hypothetical protein